MTWDEMYGIAAVEAALARGMDPKEAWQRGCSIAWEKNGRSVSDKEYESFSTEACPQNAFLGLCEQGLVKGTPPGKYSSRIRENKEYVVKAANVLLQPKRDIERDNLNVLANALRMQSMPEKMKYHGQMHVVAALLKNQLLRKSIESSPAVLES